jgi:hypothetical protein
VMLSLQAASSSACLLSLLLRATTWAGTRPLRSVRTVPANEDDSSEAGYILAASLERGGSDSGGGGGLRCAVIDGGAMAINFRVGKALL